MVNIVEIYALLSKNNDVDLRFGTEVNTEALKVLGSHYTEMDGKVSKNVPLH